MWTNVAFQHVRLLNAEVYDDLASVPFMINFESGESTGQVIWHLVDAKLGRALVEALNRVLKEHVPAPSNIHECPSCHHEYKDGETCHASRGGCPMGGDF